MHLVIGDSMVSHSTSKMVEQVSDLKKSNPKIVEPILDAIEGVSLAAIHHLNNPKELGRYMNMNHALLDALGVGHPQSPGLCSLPVQPGRMEPNSRVPVAGAAWWLSAQSRSCTGLPQAIQACDARAIVTGIDTEGYGRRRMSDRMILKLGGSVITDKGADCTVNRAALAGIAAAIAGAQRGADRRCPRRRILRASRSAPLPP